MWSSKKQPVVALSSCESEYIALAYASQEAVYLSDLFSELTFPQFSSVQMYEDNMGALQLSGTTAFSSRTKHICTRYHFLRELVASNKIIVSHVKTTYQLADILTKFLTTRSLRPSWTRQSTSLLELLYKIITNICIITCIEGRVFVILLFFVSAVCSTLCLCYRLCANIRISSLRYSRFLPDTLGHEFLKYMF